MIKVPLSTVTGNEFAVYIDKNNTVGQLKQLLEKEYNLHAFYIKLIYKAVILPDHKKIKDIEINENSCIFVHQSNLRAVRPNQPGPLPSRHPESKLSHQFVPAPEQTHSILFQQEQNKSLISNINNDNDNYINDNEINNDNSSNNNDIASLIENLTDLGFDPELCKNALQLSNNDVNAAAALLLSGDVSILQPKKQQISPNQRHRQITVEDERDHLISKYKKLTLEQQKSIDRLQQIGFNMETVMQVYFACGKDEQVAKDCLITMK